VWDAPEPTSGATLIKKHSITGFKSITSLAVDRNGRLAVANETEIQICDPLSGKPLANCQGHPRNVVSVAFHPDGKRLASAKPRQKPSDCGTPKLAPRF